jgi:hypothetical protein
MLFLWSGFSLFLFACLGFIPSLAVAQAAPTAKAVESFCRACTPTSSGYDKASGFCLPSSVTGLSAVPRSAEEQLADKSDDALAAMFLDKKRSIAVRIDFIPRPKLSKAEDAEILREPERRMLALKPGAEKISHEDAGTFELGQRKYPARGSMLKWPDEGRTMYWVSWTVPHKKRYLSFTVQYYDSPAAELLIPALEALTAVAAQTCEAR